MTDIKQDDILFRNQVIQPLISPHILSIINSSEYLQREIMAADSGHVYLTTLAGLKPGQAYAIPADLDKEGVVRISQSFLSGSPSEDYVFCETLAHELEHAIDPQCVGNPPTTSNLDPVANMAAFDYNAITSEAIATISQEIVKYEIIASAQVTNPADTMAGYNADGTACTVSTINSFKVLPLTTPTALTSDLMAIDATISGSATGGYVSSIDPTTLPARSGNVYDTLVKSIWPYFQTHAGVTYNDQPLTYSAHFAMGSAETFMSFDNAVANDPETITNMVSGDKFTLFIQNGARSIDVAAVIYDLVDQAKSADGSILFLNGSATAALISNHLQFPPGVTATVDVPTELITPDDGAAPSLLHGLSSQSGAVLSDPAISLGASPDGSQYISRSDSASGSAYKLTEKVELDTDGTVIGHTEGMQNGNGQIPLWTVDFSKTSSREVEADGSLHLVLDGGQSANFGKDGLDKLELPGMSADQIGVILQIQVDDIEDPKLGAASQMTLPDGSIFFKTGTNGTNANPSWLPPNSGESISQGASNLITGDDVQWMIADSNGNAESVPIISLVGLTDNSADPIRVYPDGTTYPKALIVAGHEDVDFLSMGNDTFIGGSGHVYLRDDFTNGDGKISLQYWGGTGDADIEATGPEDLHFESGSNHVTFGGALFPAFQPSMLHVSGFDPSKDSITPSGQNLDQLGVLVSNSGTWLQFADGGSGQQHSPWEAFGYSNFQQDPATGKMTVTGAAGSDYVKGGAEDLVVSEAGGNDTILAGAGHATVTTGAGMSSVDLSAAAYASTVTSNGQDTITSGSGADTVTLLVGMASVVGGSGRDRITDQSSGNMIQGGAGGLVLLAAANTGGDVISTARGATDTLTLGTGADSVFSGGTDTINVGAAIANITAFGSFTITQSTGTTQVMKTGGTAASATVVGGLATITGGADGNGLSINTSATGVGTQITLGLGADSITTFGPTTIQGGSGLMVFTGHANAIVTDGSGGEQVQMGGGNTQFTTTVGTHNTLNLGSGSQSVISGGNDSIYAGSGAVTVSAPTGTVLLYASTGPLTFLGGSGTSTVHGKTTSGGAMSITGGAGAMTVTGSSGNDTLVAGAGNVTCTEGNGSVSAQLGSGNATVTGGTGSDILNLVFGTSTGNGVINGFKVATDHIHLSGYGASEAQNALASKTVSGGNTALVFSGGEHLTLNGVTGLTASAFS